VRFVVQDSVEEKIQSLQEKKRVFTIPINLIIFNHYRHFSNRSISSSSGIIIMITIIKCLHAQVMISTALEGLRGKDQESRLKELSDLLD
jgi:hypothetical protein